MKIHRIQATNLNSLYGVHDVDLDRDLRGASLFLIAGPTGAGKSTLLDAVSLALFGTTPRLDDLRGEMAVAEQVMSRGAGRAQAVVEFSKWEAATSRRVRYRATWLAWRARDKADGTIQATTRSMERLEDGGAVILLVSDKRKKVVDPVFDEVLEHFTPQDFQRSILLAQGRFDAMLHASADERAEILERLTRTERYEQIGEAASRIREAWSRRLQDLQARRDAIPRGSAEEMEAARQAVQREDEALAGLECALALRRTFRDWLAQRTTLAAELTAAQAGLQRVAEAEVTAAADLARLAEHERCMPAFTLHDTLRQAEARGAALRRDQEEGARRMPDLEQAVKRAEQDAEACAAVAEGATRALDALREPVQATRAAQKAVADARSEEAGAAKALGEVQRALEDREAERTRCARTLADATAVLTAREATRAALAADAPLAAALPDLTARASAAATKATTLAREDRALADLATDLDRRQQALAADRTRLGATRAGVLGPLQAAAGAARMALHALVGDADLPALLAGLATDREALRQRGAALEEARGALARAEEARAARDARREAVEACLAAVARAREQVQGREEAEQVLAADLARAREVLAPLDRILELGVQRSQLTEEAPCPLCGSLHHPYVADPIQRARMEALHDEVRTARDAVQRAEAAGRAGAEATKEASRQVAAAEARLATAEAEHGRAMRLADDTHGRTRASFEKAGLPADAPPDALPAATREVLERLEQRRGRTRAIEEARTADQEAHDALTRENARFQKEEAALDQQASALLEAEAGRRTRSEALAQAWDDLTSQRADLARDLAAFGISATPPEAGIPTCAARAKAWTDAVDGERDARSRHDLAARDLERAAEAVARAVEAVEKARTHLGLREAARGEARKTEEAAAARLAVAWQAARAWDGPGAGIRPSAEEDPAVLLRSQESRVKALALDLERARRETDRHRQELHAARATWDARETQLRTQDEENTLLAAHLAEALQALDLADRNLLEARRLPPPDVAALDRARRVLREDRVRAEEAVRGTAERVERHRDRRPEGPGDPFDDTDGGATLADEISAFEVEMSARTRSRNDAAAALRVLEGNAGRRAEAEAAVNALRAEADVWLRLHDLIGRAGGKHFKQFAQALNLGHLLARANEHLGRLNERYHLRPVRDADSGLPTLEFEVVDRWRPAMPRSPRTLSGGESFLVSLALALGLADLRTSSMPVETLLLDEGFGTLDPHTLEVALSALGQLQASGRQVGIISHVVGLHERIHARILVEPQGEGHSRVRVEG